MFFKTSSLYPLALALIAGGIAAASDIARKSHAAVPVPKVQAVRIRNFAFVPAVVTVAAGTTVTWTNADEDPHSVVAHRKAFRSGALDTGGKFSFTFKSVGAYAYFCSLHPHMDRPCHRQGGLRAGEE